MAEIADRKLYLGPRLRVLRRELGINQTRMAEELGVSPSYLNHLERNQRPLTAQMLLRLANTYDIDMRDFVAGSGTAGANSLTEIFADGLVRDIGIRRDELIDVAENYPNVAEAIGRFYRALSDFRKVPDLLQQIGGTATVASQPLDWLRDHIQERRNHFPEIDAAAEEIATSLGDDPADLYVDLRRRLQEGHNISVRIVPEKTFTGALRHYDFHRRRLMLSDRMPMPSRLFALAYQLGLVALDPLLAATIERAAPPNDETRALLKVALANYAAAALVMPYDRFRRAAEDSRYDLPLLQAAFGVSYEQLCHRLTTLGRTGERGVPLFMLKVDPAGNISKRFASDTFPFARFGGACPRWNIHEAFRTPGEIVTQIVETPDGERYFTLSRTSARHGNARALSPVAIGLGCELKYAQRLIHADSYNLERAVPTGIGPTCHLCERIACPDRALPPITRALDMNQYQRSASPYPFRRA